MSALDDMRDERNHWIGEAKRYERLYRSAHNHRMRWFNQRNEARAALEQVAELWGELDARESDGFRHWIKSHADGTETGLSFRKFVLDRLNAALNGGDA